MCRNALVWIFPVLITAAVSGCATSGERSSDENAAIAASAPAPAQAPPERSSADRNVRQRMAAIAESNLMFRTYFDDGAPRLLNAKVSQPFEYASLLAERQTFYCVSAEIETQFSNVIAKTHTVSFRIDKRPDGAESLGNMRGRSTGLPPTECAIAKYQPFPELEQLRIKRRLAMGKPA